MRTGIIRADRKCHFIIIESLVESLEDVWAFIAEHDCLTVLGQGRFHASQPRPISLIILVDKELSLDRERLLGVNVVVA